MFTTYSTILLSRTICLRLAPVMTSGIQLAVVTGPRCKCALFKDNLWNEHLTSITISIPLEHFPRRYTPASRKRTEHLSSRNSKAPMHNYSKRAPLRDNPDAFITHTSSLLPNQANPQATQNVIIRVDTNIFLSSPHLLNPLVHHKYIDQSP